MYIIHPQLTILIFYDDYTFYYEREKVHYSNELLITHNYVILKIEKL